MPKNGSARPNSPVQCRLHATIVPADVRRPATTPQEPDSVSVGSPGAPRRSLERRSVSSSLVLGLVRPSFVPPKPIRELRNLTRYRKAQIDERSREAQRLDKVLQDTGVKLSSVATDIQGNPARAMLEALVEGERDPEVLSEMALGRMRNKVPQLQEALVGRFGEHHALILRTILAKIDFLDTAICDISSEINKVIAPFGAELALLDTITGVNRRTAEALIAEIGVDMSRFPTSGHLASWAGMCPGNNESAHKRKSGGCRKGPKWLGVHLAEAASVTGRSKDTYLGAQQQRLSGRIGYGKANKAVGHSILVTASHILSNDVPHEDLGSDWFVKRRPEAHARRLAKQIEALGYSVEITPTAARHSQHTRLILGATPRAAVARPNQRGLHELSDQGCTYLGQ